MNGEQAKTQGASTNPVVGGKLGISYYSQVVDGVSIGGSAMTNCVFIVGKDGV